MNKLTHFNSDKVSIIFLPNNLFGRSKVTGMKNLSVCICKDMLIVDPQWLLQGPLVFS